MRKNKDRNTEIKRGLLAGLPIVIGYIPVAMAFGVLAKSIELTMYESVLFSLIVFAGASQFIALNLLALGIGFGEIILTTFLVNIRHLLMSASLSTKLEKTSTKWKFLIAFGVTDESFSVSASQENKLSKEFMLPLHFFAYLSWVLGTLIGFLVGGILPESLSESMGIALYALFATLLVPHIKKGKEILILAITSALIHTILNYLSILPQGWNIVVSIIIASTLGVFLFDKGEAEKYE